jgi:hypothetical protein
MITRVLSEFFGKVSLDVELSSTNPDQTSTEVISAFF